LNINWKVGGATIVNSCDLYYQYVPKGDKSFSQRLAEKFEKSED
jgi:hypothetical protein